MALYVTLIVWHSCFHVFNCPQLNCNGVANGFGRRKRESGTERGNLTTRVFVVSPGDTEGEYGITWCEKLHRGAGVGRVNCHCLCIYMNSWNKILFVINWYAVNVRLLQYYLFSWLMFYAMLNYIPICMTAVSILVERNLAELADCTIP